MSFYYITPVTSQTQTLGGQSVSINAPKYLQTDMKGLSFSAIPFGGDGWAIVSLSASNAALSAESDVYSFGDSNTVMAAGDVTTLSAFLNAANIPSAQIVSGMTFAAALQVIAKIFLTAQALLGLTGSAIFSPGDSLSTTIQDSNLAPITTVQATLGGNSGSSQQSGGSASGGSQQSAPIQSGPFDFSTVQATDTIGSMLDSVSTQFSQQVNLGTF